MQVSRVCSFVGSLHGPGAYVPFSRQSIRSLCGRPAQESIEGDMLQTLEIFRSMRVKDPSLIVNVHLDNKKRVRLLFWCLGRTNF